MRASSRSADRLLPEVDQPDGELTQTTAGRNVIVSLAASSTVSRPWLATTLRRLSSATRSRPFRGSATSIPIEMVAVASGTR